MADTDPNAYPPKADATPIPGTTPPSEATRPAIAPPVDDKEAQSAKEGEAAVLRAKKRWEYVESVDADNRKNHLDDLRFCWKRGEQWNEQIRKQRDLQKRPWLEFNQTGQFIKQITNDIRQFRPSITVRPDGAGASDPVADLYSGLVRKIQYDSSADAIYDSAAEQAVTAGRGYMRVITEYEDEDSFVQRLRILAVPNALAVYLDPDAQAPDKSDAQYGFVCEWIDRDTFEAEHGDNPAAAMVSWDSDGQAGEFSTWYQGDKVCVCDYYELVREDDTLHQMQDGSTIWQSEVEKRFGTNFPIHPQKSTPRKRTRCVWYKLTASPTPLAKYRTVFSYIPIVMVVGDEMDVEGEHIYRGVVRNMRDAQMMFNYHYTAAVESIALSSKAPWIGVAGQFEGHPEWDTANTENHAYLEYEIVYAEDGTAIAQPPVRNSPPEPPAAHVQMCTMSANLLRECSGIKDPALGQHTQEQSGVAILARDRISDNATFHYVDNLARAVAFLGCIIVDAIPETYDTDREITTLGLDGKDKRQRVNYGSTPSGGKINDLTRGKYGVVVDTGPSYQTQRIEAANKLAEFMNVLPQEQRPLVADLAAKMLDAPDKLGDTMAARLFAMLPPQVQMADAQSKAGEDPKYAALMAAMQTQQQQSQQQVQGLTQQLTDLQTTNTQLETMLMNKGKELDARMAEWDAKREDFKERNELTEVKILLDNLTKLMTSQFQSPQLPAQAAGDAPAVKTAAQELGA